MAVPITNMKISDIITEIGLPVGSSYVIDSIVSLFSIPIMVNSTFGGINPYGIDPVYCEGETALDRYNNLTSNPYYMGKWRNYRKFSFANSQIRYGFIYNWYAASHELIAPEGWHVANDSDWDYLKNYYVENTASNGFKSCRTVNSGLEGYCDTSEHPRWDEISHSSYLATNYFKFHAVPAGYRNSLIVAAPPANLGGQFGGLGNVAYFITSDTIVIEETEIALTYQMQLNSNVISRGGAVKNTGGSIRLVKDNSTWNDMDVLYDIDGNAYGTVRIGDLIWTKQNLATTRFRNGDSINFIPFDVSAPEWMNVYNNIWNILFPYLPDLVYPPLSEWITTTSAAFCTYADDFDYAFRETQDIYDYPSIWHE